MLDFLDDSESNMVIEPASLISSISNRKPRNPFKITSTSLKDDLKLSELVVESD